VATPPSAGKGGWRRCGHPHCRNTQYTLLRLTGRKDGVPHRLRADVRVCKECKSLPWPGHSSPEKRDALLIGHDLDPSQWAADSPAKLVDLYAHTAQAPQKFSYERWVLTCRVCRLLCLPPADRPARDPYNMAKMLRPLRLSRQRIARALEHWKPGEDNSELIAYPPRGFVVGKYGKGALSQAQKKDLAIWVRGREQMNVGVAKAEILHAIAKFMAVNSGIQVSDYVEMEEMDEDTARRAANAYRSWLTWVHDNMPEGYRIQSKIARTVKAVEAAAMTPASVQAELNEIRELLVRHNIMCPESSEITKPHLLWCLDEKGLNDERLSAARLLYTRAAKMSCAATARQLRHLSVLSCVSASGLAAPAGVVLSGHRYHPKWSELWPEAVIHCTPKGSFTARNFVEVLGETLIPFLRDQAGRGEDEDVVLILDTGGGVGGMHLSLEFGVLMATHRIFTKVLRPYHTRGLMPLDRAPHRAMECTWGRLRRLHHAQNGVPVLNHWVALPLACAAWKDGTRPEVLKAGWRETGLCPWNPSLLLDTQAPELFKHLRPQDVVTKFTQQQSASILQLPDTHQQRRVPCTECKARVPSWCKYCPDCGKMRESHDAQGALVHSSQPRQGFKRSRPPGFDIEALMATHFEGLPSCLPALAGAAPVATDAYGPPEGPPGEGDLDPSQESVPDAALEEYYEQMRAAAPVLPEPAAPVSEEPKAVPNKDPLEWP